MECNIHNLYLNIPLCYLKNSDTYFRLVHGETEAENKREWPTLYWSQNLSFLRMSFNLVQKMPGRPSPNKSVRIEMEKLSLGSI